MDHLLLPAETLPTEDDIVPCLVEKDYIGVPFKSYPLSHDFAHAIRGHHELTFDRYENLYPTPQIQLEKFIQTWCFFCLLQELLGEGFRHDDFVAIRLYHGQPIQALCTTKLMHLLKRAFSQPRSPFESESYLQNITECYELARETEVVFHRINQTTAISIGSVLEAIGHSTYGGRSLILEVSTPRPSSLAWSFLISQMTANGWCVNEASYCLRRLNSISCLFFLSKMRRKYTLQDHRNCDQNRCIALQIDPSKYRIGHPDSTCMCDIVSICNIQLERILENGNLPLLDFTFDAKTGGFITRLVESDGTLPYIALSHIWADGLGNPHANALHTCQLVQLRYLATLLFESTTNELSRPVTPLIWLDTLCCPSETGKGKNIAMGMMRKVYREATHVLVLDDAIRSQKYAALHPIEAAIRVFTAPWNRRLWCLQEGALPLKLWFQFNDRAVEIQSIYEPIKAAFFGDDTIIRAIAMQLTHHLFTLRDFFHPLEYGCERDLAAVSRAVEDRGVSVASDEPLCLAALLNLDVESLVKTTHAQARMAKFWELMCAGDHVPSRIIFEPVPKLDVERFRWAPCSLLNRGMDTPTDGKKSALHSKGLMVAYPGFQMSIANTRGYEAQALQPVDEPLKLRDRNTGQWYQIQLLKLETSATNQTIEFRPAYVKKDSLYENVKDGSASLILNKNLSDKDEKDFSTDKPFERAVLVNRKESIENCHFVKLYSNARLIRYRAGMQRFFDHALRIAQSLRHDDASLRFGKEQSLYKNLREAVNSSSYQVAQTAVVDVLKSKLEKLIEDEDLAESLEYHFNNLDFGKLSLIKITWGMYLDQYLVIDSWYPADTYWCVD